MKITFVTVTQPSGSYMLFHMSSFSYSEYKSVVNDRVWVTWRNKMMKVCCGDDFQFCLHFEILWAWFMGMLIFKIAAEVIFSEYSFSLSCVKSTDWRTRPWVSENGEPKLVGIYFTHWVFIAVCQSTTFWTGIGILILQCLHVFYVGFPHLGQNCINTSMGKCKVFLFSTGCRW